MHRRLDSQRRGAAPALRSNLQWQGFLAGATPPLLLFVCSRLLFCLPLKTASSARWKLGARGGPGSPGSSTVSAHVPKGQTHWWSTPYVAATMPMMHRGAMAQHARKGRAGSPTNVLDVEALQAAQRAADLQNAGEVRTPLLLPHVHVPLALLVSLLLPCPCIASPCLALRCALRCVDGRPLTVTPWC